MYMHVGLCADTTDYQQDGNWHSAPSITRVYPTSARRRTSSQRCCSRTTPRDPCHRRGTNHTLADSAITNTKESLICRRVRAEKHPTRDPDSCHSQCISLSQV
ncbi:hypothetical protein FOPG_13962 [Fusarium oxysporum f. sp. conglutinans race 2 54008]|uniref:Uncharacterized protein n=2 Tax=Fusarium oxysporum TaxID=5507 RepID=X0IAB6_FUSOX|nr:hypothetical protein FOVG_09507 [Fusarium oxysporum f. sp. pisi HDV247]EXL70209.1 hypothetical protein FOPG_13962 [Fusarium oxysporum f. sp. conglutinans race 2 54008]KAI8408555.1 hypothetical protein FOFC_11500 [Fusarium oxysporum]